jgi:putative ABC transport system permease protein
MSEGAANFVRVVGSIVSIFFAVGAMIGAMITMYAAVANRQREIGTLRALGFSRTSILGSFLLESVLLAAVGGAVGTCASFGMSLVHFSMVNLASWSETVFSFELTPLVVVKSILFACGMGLLGGLFPAVRAARTSALKAIRA